MKRKKKRNNNIIKIVLFFLILIILFFLYKKIVTRNSDVNEVSEMNDFILFNISDDSESDYESVKTYFMDGMSTSDFKSVLEKQPTEVKNGKFGNINYDFDRKLHYSELEELYSSISSSSIANTYIIGSSVDDRNVYGITIGRGDKVLFLDANIHAAEVSTTLILTKFLIDVVNEYESGNNEIINALDEFKIVAIPCINPDGYEIYNYGVESLRNKNLWVYQNKDKINFDNIKCNANGIDLNRNFPTQNVGLYYNEYNLIKNTSINPTTEHGKYFNGYSAGSEPEIKAAMYFMLKHYKNTYAYINLHSQGRVLYAGKPNLSNEFNKLTNSFANFIFNYTGYKVHGLSSEEVGEGNDGSATDFMAELANGFYFSTKTGRLSTDKYKNNSSVLEYKYPVVTMEITKTWTDDPLVFKSEYYNYGIKEILFDLIKNKF